MLIYWSTISTIFNYFHYPLSLIVLKGGRSGCEMLWGAVRCCERFWTAHSWNILEYLSLLLSSNFGPNSQISSYLKAPFEQTDHPKTKTMKVLPSKSPSEKPKALRRRGGTGPWDIQVPQPSSLLGSRKLLNKCMLVARCSETTVQSMVFTRYFKYFSWIHCRSRFQMRNSTIPDVCRDSSNQGPGPSLWHLLSACGWRQRFQVPKVPAVATLAGIWNSYG